MYIKKTYYYNECGEVMHNSNLSEKARDDHFEPITMQSSNYKHWVAHLDLKTCQECSSNHGKVYEINEVPDQSPPIHPNCRCKIKEMEAVEAGNATNNSVNGADYWLKYYGNLPDYYISSVQLEELGWNKGDRPSKFAPGKMLGRDLYDNSDRHLPVRIGRIWYEADINYTVGRRNSHRILWSNDGLIFVTYDHYHTFYEII